MNGQFKYIAGAFILFLFTAGCFLLLNSLHYKFATDDPQELSIDQSIVPETKITGNAVLGKNLFMANCASCHNIFKDGTGPSLGGFEDRGKWADRAILYKWVKNPAAFMRTDDYTRTLKAKFGSMMTAFPNIKNEEIDAICDYINQAVVESVAMPMAVR